MKFLRHILFLLLLSLGLNAQANTQASEPYRTEQAEVQLLAYAPKGIAPGQAVWLGLQIAHAPQWHSYWKNPGDAGLPTQLQWTLPDHIQAGEIAWPTPHKIPVGPLANYGYTDTVLLPVPLQIDKGFAAAELPIQVKASWLICRVECLQQSTTFTVRLPTQTPLLAHAQAFEKTWRAQPQALPKASATAHTTTSANTTTLTTHTPAAGRLHLSVQGLPASWRGKPLALFVEQPNFIETAAAPTQQWDKATWQAEVPLAPYRDAGVTPLGIVLVNGEQAYRLEAVLKDATAPAISNPSSAPVPAPAAPKEATAETPTSPNWWLALLGAFLGGMLLNLMPCVFPVLAIKLLHFTQHPSSLKQRRLDGWAYAVGVVLGFSALGLLLLSLRAGGHALGWGFQLQSPLIVSLLAVLFTVLGLNLVGVFEFGGFLPQRWRNWQPKHPLANAFASGLLCVAIASPCTTPFMGAALGLALGLPAWQALGIFIALGAGMALPFVAASLAPGIVRWLPRPGAWMQTFRTLMAFFMWGTVVWLLWVLGQQTHIHLMALVLLQLLLLSALIWAWQLRGAARPYLTGLLALALVGGLWVTGSVMRPVANAAAANALWQPWQPGKVESLLAQQQSVFVDFTAAWCITCQYNKHTTLANPEALAAFAAKKVTLLRADWTDGDPAITQALRQLGRSGVPTYVLYVPGKAPQVLSELPTVGQIQAAVAAL